MKLIEIEYKAGKDLVGCIVEVWQDSKFGGFKSVGECIKYRKQKKKKWRNNYLIKFKGTKNQGEFFKIWMPRNMLTQI